MGGNRAYNARPAATVEGLTADAGGFGATPVIGERRASSPFGYYARRRRPTTPIELKSTSGHPLGEPVGDWTLKRQPRVCDHRVDTLVAQHFSGAMFPSGQTRIPDTA
ncbi:hypothetical protein [Nitrosospira sp. Nl5]|uniref:hypothetical protein n=1 Tax=Nitrosospira sp. Nl5 TaxID=200120 RepID=UPI00115FD17A|nr:hypothetical protein [Nitrosospira sp. Nl5]